MPEIDLKQLRHIYPNNSSTFSPILRTLIRCLTKVSIAVAIVLFYPLFLSLSKTCLNFYDFSHVDLGVQLNVFQSVEMI